MTEKSKLETLRNFGTETAFREKVLVPLFEKRGIEQVTLTHGTGERGKDIVGKENNRLDRCEWLAVVVKIGKVTGSTSAADGFQNVANQVQEAFSYAYKDPISKTPVPINKVFVVTNDDIKETAREKIVDNITGSGSERANTHFLDGSAVVALIDESWPEFWEESNDLLIGDQVMSDVAALVLYVLACAYKRAQSRERGIHEMSIEQIISQTHCTKVDIENALPYLIQAQYVEASSKKKSYSLHRLATAGKLLLDLDLIRILMEARKIVNAERFSGEELKQACAKEPFKFKSQFVEKSLITLTTMGYIEKDEGRGDGNYILNLHTYEEEVPYFNGAIKYNWQTPPRG